ncbi:unnamed protein product [Arctogadus glacialis]
MSDFPESGRRLSERLQCGSAGRAALSQVQAEPALLGAQACFHAGTTWAFNGTRSSAEAGRGAGIQGRHAPCTALFNPDAVSGFRRTPPNEQLQKMLLLIYVKLALLHLATSSPEIVGNCKENATLKCDGIIKGSFNSITWTKMPSSRIIRRSRDKIQHYQFNRTADLTDENSLLLPDLTPEDSGTYECQIGAKVGGQNTFFKVVLEVPVCVTEPPTPEPPDLPIPQTVGCFLVICLLKLLLPIIVAQVFHGLRTDVKSENPVPLS